MDPMNPNSSANPKIINRDGAMFEFGNNTKDKVDEREHRQLFEFDYGDAPPVVVDEDKLIRRSVFSADLLKQSVSDAIVIAKNNGMKLNTITLNNARSIIQTSLEVLKHRLKASDEPVTSIKLCEVVEEVNKPVNDKTTSLPFEELILSLNGAIGIAKNEKVDTDKLMLGKAQKILNAMYKILEKKSNTRSNPDSIPIAYPPSIHQVKISGLSQNGVQKPDENDES